MINITAVKNEEMYGRVSTAGDNFRLPEMRPAGSIPESGWDACEILIKHLEVSREV